MFNSYFMLYKAKKTIRNIIKHPRLTLGKDVYVDPTAFMIGRNNIAIGDYSIVGEFSRFNVNKRDAEIRIRIGKNCLINRGTFFLTSNLIDVKDYFLGGENCRLLGANHDILHPTQPYVRGECDDDREIVIGTNVWFGANVTVLGHVHIGHGAIIGANSLVTHDVPPFAMAVGSPAKVIKRFDFQRGLWVPLSEVREDATYMDEAEYKKLIEEKYPRIRLPLEAVSRRFGEI